MALCLALTLVLAGQARAATLSTPVVDSPYLDYCGDRYEIHYEAWTAERNDVQFSSVPGQNAPALTPGPICWQATSDLTLVTDLSAPISADQRICENLTRRAASCATNLIDRLVVVTYDQRDLVKVEPLSPPADVSTGSGDDDVNVRNGQGGDAVHCGPGRDTVGADSGDQVDADCEIVKRLL